MSFRVDDQFFVVYRDTDLHSGPSRAPQGAAGTALEHFI